MTTTNLVSTPNITGNIGSCTTQSVVVKENSNLIKDSGYTIVTNSCTGVVEKYDYHSFNGGVFIIGAGIFVLLFVLLMGWANSY